MDPAELVQVGRSGVRISRLGFGTSGLGGWPATVPEADAMATLEAAWAAGIRYFDTAPMYGHGVAEELLGRFARSKGSDATVSTKVGRLLRDVPMTASHGPGDGRSFFEGQHALNPTFDFTYDGIVTSLEESLARLGTDRVDIALVHDPDDYLDEALGGALRALEDLRASGRVSAIGAGMVHAEPLARLAREGAFDCFLVAGRYTLLDQSALDAFLPACSERGVSVIAAGVFNSGLLADPRPGAPFDYGPAPAALVARAERIARICADHATPIAAAAAQFPFGHPSVACVLIGMRTVAEVEQNRENLQRQIPDALWTDLKREGLLRSDAPVPLPAAGSP